jgi:hypothetical protein
MKILLPYILKKMVLFIEEKLLLSIIKMTTGKVINIPFCSIIILPRSNIEFHATPFKPVFQKLLSTGLKRSILYFTNQLLNTKTFTL